MSLILLPNEIKLQILECLSFQDRVRIRLVCRNFRKLSFLGIDELSFGRFNVIADFYSYPRPKYEVTHSNTLKQLEMFYTVLKESGQSIKLLSFGPRAISGKKSVEKEDEQEYFRLWKLTINTLIVNCSKIDHLVVFPIFYIPSSEMFESILQKIGKQLVGFFYGYSPGALLNNFVSNYLNPQKLRKLSFDFECESDFTQLSKRFFRLTHLFIVCKLDFISDKTLNDYFHDLHRFVHLQSFGIRAYYSQLQLNAISKTPFAKNLQFLCLGNLSRIKNCDSLGAMANLKILDVNLESVEHLSTIAAKLPLLEVLTLALAMPDDQKHLFEQHFQSLGQLKYLKKLKLFCSFRNGNFREYELQDLKLLLAKSIVS